MSEPSLRIEKASLDAMIQRVDGPTYVVQQTFADVQIDGDLREWAGVAPILLNDAAHAAEGWRGPEDVSATAYLMWDRLNLYVACDVIDDELRSPSPECVWDGDCLELAFDPLHDGKGPGFDRDDSHVGIALLERGPIVCSADAPSGKPSWSVRDDVEAAVVKKVGERGYVYEVRFPWEALGVEGPRLGKEWGFTLGVVDHDGKKAGGLRWSRGLQTPREISAFGHLIFTGAAPSLVEVSQAISTQVCGDEETLSVDVIINSPDPRDDLWVSARLLSHRNDVLQEVTQRVEIHKGVNLYGVVWDSGHLPMGVYTLQTEVVVGKGVVLDQRDFEVFKHSSGIVAGIVAGIASAEEQIGPSDRLEPSLLEAERDIECVRNRLRAGTLAVDRVFYEILAMHDGGDLGKVMYAVGSGLHHLGVRCSYCTIRVVDDGVETVRSYGMDGPEEVAVWRSGATDGELVRHWQAQQGYTYRWEQDVPEAMLRRIGGSLQRKVTLEIASVPFPYGMLEIAREGGETFAEWEIRTLQGFADLVSLGYTRFLDFQRLELERAAGRVRLEVLSMQASKDIVDVIRALWEGVTGCVMEVEALWINRVDGEADTLQVYRMSRGMVPQPPPQKLLLADVVEGVHLWRSEVPRGIAVERGWVRQEGQPGRWTTPVTFPDDMRDVWGGGDWPMSLTGRQAVSVPFTHGELCALAPEGGYFTGQDVQTMAAFAEVVSLGYTRFFDLKRVDAQHRLMLEEAAIERVQMEVESMTESQELFQVVGVVEQSLKDLGVRCDDVGIYTMDEETGVVLLYNSDGLIAAGSLKAGSLGQLYARWREGKTQHQFWTKDDVVQLWAEWFNVGHWTEDVLLKGIVERWGDRWVVNVPFLKWTLTMNSRASEPFSQEEIRLLERFAKVVSIGYARFLDFQRVEEAQSQLVGELARELRIAHDVQMGILPQTVPEISGYDIAGVCFPANHVGGDYYEYLWVDDARTKLAIVVADVSGKGMKAAMAVMRFSEILRYEIHGRQSSDEILAGMNRSVYGRLEQLLYVTVCVGVLDGAGRSLEVSQAGHPPVYHLSSQTGRVMEVGAYDMPLGLAPEVEYPSQATGVAPGDLLVFYTDGVYEARNRDGELYGFQRLERVIGEREPNRSAGEWVDRIVADVERFSGSSQQEDDLTVVVVKVLGTEGT